MDTTRENIASKPPTSTGAAGDKPNQRIFVVGGATSPIGMAFIEELSQIALHHQQRLPASFSQFESSPQICIKAIVDGNDNHKQVKDQLAHLPFVEIVLLPDWIDDAACGSGESATSTAATTSSSASRSTFNNPKSDSGNINNSPKAAPLTSPYSSPALSLSAQRRVNSLRQVMYGASRAFLVLETNHHLFELETVFIDACMATPTMEYLLRVSTASPVISPHFNQLQIQDLQEKNERFLTGEDAVPFDVPYFGYHQWLVDCYLNRVSSPIASGLAGSGSSLGGSPASSSPTTLGSSRLGMSPSSASASSHSQQVARARRPSFSTFPLVANNTNWSQSEGHPSSSSSASSQQPKPFGLAWTVLRPDWFMQNALPFFQGSLQAEGRAFLPADPAHPFALIDARDIGALSARLLGLEDVELIRNRLHGKFLELHGPRMSSFQELIQAIHQQTRVLLNSSGMQSEEHQPILPKPQQQQGGGGVSSLSDWKAVSVSGKQWMEKMRQYRPECRQEVLEGVVQMFRIMTGEWPQAVDYTPETSAILKEFGMPQRTVEDFARDYASHFLPSGFVGGSGSASSSTFTTSSVSSSAPMAKSKGPQDVKETGERYAAGTFSGLH